MRWLNTISKHRTSFLGIALSIAIAVGGLALQKTSHPPSTPQVTTQRDNVPSANAENAKVERASSNNDSALTSQPALVETSLLPFHTYTFVTRVDDVAGDADNPSETFTDDTSEDNPGAASPELRFRCEAQSAQGRWSPIQAPLNGDTIEAASIRCNIRNQSGGAVAIELTRDGKVRFRGKLLENSPNLTMPAL